jgi:hypothetical protein
MKVIRRETWAVFKNDLGDYASRNFQRRAQLVFRGHTDTNWPLQSTLDRHRPDFKSDEQRAECFAALIREFRREAVGLASASYTFPLGDALELLARHHGLPSTLLDWTESPYVASYFAFDGAADARSASVAVWMLDRTLLKPEWFGTVIDLIDDRDLLRFNVRAIEQRGVFTRVLTVKQPAEQLLSDALVKFELPSTERGVALAELDAMTITAKNLFRDFDGAARTASNRVL